ncbi:MULTISPECIES: DapH/DapD/GlmU-related protein [Nosocomiicoccus]|uniref:acyltransferase n=1 Tax=Nosocomiicoccus TaxID=489909 RepID=UPI00082C4184|nr:MULTISPECIES: acyltransferase [Nosocomiicoccus]OFL47584.1 acetyltransferase [Nosocomiicoccus sp. HMSC067E10]OFO53036.1 acetyltransferase [Nosocomiicoccus sp. HMSC059G07]OFS62859.1 acetyltransferase [Nosocomiicoccus sp. HMSC09A07]
MRKLERFPSKKENPLWRMYRTISFFRVVKNFIIVEAGRYSPSTRMKHTLYKTGLNMKLGDKVSFAYKAMPDLFYPENITVGENSIIGYNATLLTHEYLVDEYRIGSITIGKNTMIGANVTVLPGVTIGDNVLVGAGSVVSKDIPDNSIAYGNPLVIKERSDIEK